MIVIRRSLAVALALSLALLLPAAAGCVVVQTGETVEETRTVELDAADRVEARFELSSGEFELAGGAEDLMVADFRYNVDRWRPDVEYQVSNGTGRLNVIQPRVGTVVGGSVSRWDIQMMDGVPLELEVRSSSGNVDVSLDDLEALKLDVDVSSGDVFVEAPGVQLDLEEVRIETSSGGTDVELVGGYSRLRDVSVRSSSGSVDLDLTGDWDTDCDVDVSASSGEVTIVVPDDVEVRVRVDASSGKISADGFTIDGDEYTLEGDRGASRLTIDVDVSSGDVNLIVR
jgi:hypothetical protein